MKTRWGILGTAGIAINHVIPAMLQCDRSEVTAVASRNGQKAAETAGKFGIKKAYGSYEELLSDSDIEAVYIPLPNHLHAEWSIRAMEAGKHVLCEKPFALSTEDVSEVIKVRDKTGMKISEAYMVKLHPQWIRAVEAVKNGEIGTLKNYQSLFTYNNTDPANIRNIREKGGGSVWDVGCYPVFTSRMLFGQEPEQVLAIMDFDANFGTDVLSSAILKYPSGQAVFIVSTQTVRFQKVIASGTEKLIEMPLPFNPDPQAEAEIFIGDLQDKADGKGREIFMACNHYSLQADAFSRAIQEGLQVAVPLEDTLKTTAVLNALYRSAESGNWEVPEK